MAGNTDPDSASKTISFMGALKPGCIYSAKTLKGEEDPQALIHGNNYYSAGDIGALDISKGNIRGRRDSYGSGDASSPFLDGARGPSPMPTSRESLWGSISSEPLFVADNIKKMKPYTTEVQKDGISMCMIDRTAVRTRVKPLDAGRKHLYTFRQGMQQRRFDRDAYKYEKDVHDDDRSETSTIVLNTKTHRLERRRAGRGIVGYDVDEGRRVVRGDVGVKDIGRALSVRGFEEIEIMSSLWEAFERANNDNSGWIYTNDIKWCIVNDMRTIHIYGLELKNKKKSDTNDTFVHKLFSWIKNGDEPPKLCRSSLRKQQAILNEVRRVESVIISNDRATENPKITFSTYVHHFAKYVGKSDPAKWAGGDDIFVEVAAEKDTPYCLSMAEMLVRDAVLGTQLTSIEAWYPDYVTPSKVKIIEPPGLSTLDRRSKEDERRKAETVHRIKRYGVAFEEKLGGLMALKAAETECALLRENVEKKANEEFLELSDGDLKKKMDNKIKSKNEDITIRLPPSFNVPDTFNIAADKSRFAEITSDHKTCYNNTIATRNYVNDESLNNGTDSRSSHMTATCIDKNITSTISTKKISRSGQEGGKMDTPNTSSGRRNNSGNKNSRSTNISNDNNNITSNINNTYINDGNNNINGNDNSIRSILKNKYSDIERQYRQSMIRVAGFDDDVTDLDSV